ncbi:hypothetical protein H2202_011016 [Exophiala xenobiotica]|nr:hypothetical protein H2202_011016 [Exophiala xenobiotica]
MDSAGLSLTMVRSCAAVQQRVTVSAAMLPIVVVPQTPLEVVVPPRHLSVPAVPGVSAVRKLSAAEALAIGGRRTTSPLPGAYVDLTFAHQTLVDGVWKAGSNNMLSLFDETLADGSPARDHRIQRQLHTPNFEDETPPRFATAGSTYEPDREQTHVDRRANPTREDESGRDVAPSEWSGIPATRRYIVEPLNHHQQYQGGLKSMSVQPVTPADTAFITALIDSPTDIRNVLHSPAAWTLGCGGRPARLANISAKPLTSRYWLMTATMSQSYGCIDNLRRDRVGGRKGTWSPDPNMSSDYCPSGRGKEVRGLKRGQWTTEVDDSLTHWRRLGKSWSWIFDQFPERSEAAVRSRWFVVLAPRQTSRRTPT